VGQPFLWSRQVFFRRVDAQWQVIVYYGGALPLTYTTVRYASLAIAIALWILYFHEILFRSGRIQMRWLKKRVTDLVLVLSIALVTFLVFSFVGGFHSGSHRAH
jgi:hypothetical protein